MNYSELVDELNKDMKSLEYINKPLTLYKDEQASMAEIKIQQDESLKAIKKFVYPFWSILFDFNGLLFIGYFYQDKLISKGQTRIDRLEKFDQYSK